MTYEIPWPYCGERRSPDRKVPRNQFEQELLERLRGGRETILVKKPHKTIEIYEWDEPWRK